MDEIIITYVRAKRIDSFQKLRFVLFLYRNPGLRATSQELADRLHLGDTSLVDTIISELASVGIIGCIDNHCTLIDKPENRKVLQLLDQIFDNPLTRLQLLEQLKNGSSVPQHSRTSL